MRNRDPKDRVVVSSLVVRTRRGCSAPVAEAIGGCDGAAVVSKRPDGLAVVLEAGSTPELAAATDRIRAITGVTGVELVVHFFEEEIPGN